MGKPTQNGKAVLRYGNRLGTKGPSVAKLPPNWQRAIISQMTIMRFQGKTAQECDEWLENFIQEIERIERESNG